jgi:hypothetical protein
MNINEAGYTRNPSSYPLDVIGSAVQAAGDTQQKDLLGGRVVQTDAHHLKPLGCPMEEVPNINNLNKVLYSSWQHDVFIRQLI